METAALAADAAWGARLQSGAAALGVALDEAQVVLFARFLELLRADAKRSGLTSITDPDAVARLHFLDSLAGLRSEAFPDGAAVADVGAGGGLPGIALALARPDLRLTLIESHHRRAEFMRQAVADLSIAGAAVVTARAEAAGRDPALREQFDLVVCRAVAAPAVALEYMSPLARVGGWVVAYWGPKATLSPNPALKCRAKHKRSPSGTEEEVESESFGGSPLSQILERGDGGEGSSASAASPPDPLSCEERGKQGQVLAAGQAPLLTGEGCRRRGEAMSGEALDEVAAELGLRLDRVDAFTLPGGDEQRALWIFEKIAATPSRYPRREGIPAKRPLGGRPPRGGKTAES